MNPLDIIEKLFIARASEREIADFKIALHEAQSLIKDKDSEIANLKSEVKELRDRLEHQSKPSKTINFKLSGFDRGGNDNMI